MAKETEGGVWINVNNKEEKGHVNIYGSDPRETHNESIHINIDYEKGNFTINEKIDGEKTSTDGHCFLTTACMRHFQSDFDDECYELLVLRRFRDMFVVKEDINHYYRVAPLIVSSINAQENQNEIYNYIYENVIKYCINNIEKGNYELAYDRYKSIVLSLERELLENDSLKLTL